MKRVVSFLAAAGIAFLCTGCIQNLEIPRKISIATSAKYKFTVAEVEKDLTELSPIDSMLANLSTDSYKLYKYNPEEKSDIQQLMMRMDVQEIPFDMSSYLQSADFSQLSGIDISQEIPIPDALSFEDTQTLPLENINDAINTLLIIAGVNEGDISFNYDLPGNGFTSISYQSGYLDVTCPTTGSVSLKHNGNVVSSANFVDGKAALPLAGVVLYETGMSIDFENPSAYYIGKIRAGSKVGKAVGLSLSTDQSIPITIDSISWGNNSVLKSCKIKSGELGITLNTNNWTKGMLSYKVDLNGGLTQNVNGDDRGKATVNLANCQITNEDIDVDSAITLHLANSTIDFTNAPTFKFEIAISEIASATFKLADSYKLSYSISQELPQEALDFIKSVKWNSSGLKIKGTNNFPKDNLDPAANQIGFTVASTYFGISSSTKYLTAGTPNQELPYMGSAVTRDTATYNTIDIDVGLVLPGYDPVEKTVTVKNVKPGESYSLNISAEPVLDWEEITINSNKTRQTGGFASGINLSSLLDSLTSTLGSDIGSKIQLKNCNLYMFCDIPEIDGLANPQFKGVIKGFIGKENGDHTGYIENPNIEPVYILGESNGSSGVLGSKSIPQLATKDTDLPDGSKVTTVTTDIAKAVNDEGKNIAPLFNASKAASDESLCLTYDIMFTSDGDGNDIKIGKAIMENQGAKSIKISVLAIIPITFKLSDDVNVDILKMIKQDWSDDSDLLGRSEAPSTDGIQKMLDVVDSVSIDYTSSKVPFKCSKPIEMNVDLDGAGSKFKAHKLTLESGSISENPSDVINTYPLQPSINLKLPQDCELSLPNTMSIKMNIKLGIDTNGTPVELWGGNE